MTLGVASYRAYVTAFENNQNAHSNPNENISLVKASQSQSRIFNFIQSIFDLFGETGHKLGEKLSDYVYAQERHACKEDIFNIYRTIDSVLKYGEGINKQKVALGLSCGGLLLYETASGVAFNFNAAEYSNFVEGLSFEKMRSAILKDVETHFTDYGFKDADEALYQLGVSNTLSSEPTTNQTETNPKAEDFTDTLKEAGYAPHARRRATCTL